MRRRLFLPALALSAAAATLTVLPGGAAQAVNGRLGIHAVTKTLTQGDTSRVRGKVVGAGKGVTVTIQQRSGSRGKDWGSGRRVQTDAKGKFTLDRVIKGKFTRDYRACIGPKNKRQCSLRARIQVVPRQIGVYLTQAPANVTAGATMTVKGSTDAELVGRTATLEQLNPSTLAWLPVATAAIAPNATFEATGTPLVPGKAGIFRVSVPPTGARPKVTLSNRFTANVFGYYSLTTYTPLQGGFRPGPATFTRPNNEVVAYPVGSVLAVSDPGTVTVNLNGSCDRFIADAFLDSTTSVASDRMNIAVSTAVGGSPLVVRDAKVGIAKGDPLQQLNANVTDATTMTITQAVTPANPGDPNNTFDPVWLGNPLLSCAL